MTAYTHFKCNQCGSDLDYAIGLHSLRCGSCGYVDPIESAPLDQHLAHDYQSAVSELSYFDPSAIDLELKCINCGANFIMDTNVHADECPYCDMNVVVPADSQRTLEPDGVIPFEIEQHQAEKAFKEWLHGLWFAPSALKRKAIQAQGIVGSYMPLWAFDAEVSSNYQGARGDNYTTTVRVPRKVNGRTIMQTQTVVKIRWRNCSGWVQNSFDDVITLGTHTLPLKFQNFLSEWNLSATQNYNEKYLSGFRSELYQIGLPEALKLAKDIMYRTIRATVRRDIGGDHQQIHHIDSTYQQVGYKLLLAPMWISAFNYNKKTYRYVINGQSGQAHGERPYSVWKILGAVMLVAILAGTTYVITQQ